MVNKQAIAFIELTVTHTFKAYEVELGGEGMVAARLVIGVDYNIEVTKGDKLVSSVDEFYFAPVVGKMGSAYCPA